MNQPASVESESAPLDHVASPERRGRVLARILSPEFRPVLLSVVGILIGTVPPLGPILSNEFGFPVKVVPKLDIKYLLGGENYIIALHWTLGGIALVLAGKILEQIETRNHIKNERWRNMAYLGIRLAVTAGTVLITGGLGFLARGFAGSRLLMLQKDPLPEPTLPGELCHS